MSDFSMQPLAYEVISRLVPPTSTILELGSGEGDRNLVNAGYRVFAVEHDQSWIGVVPGVDYIHAPLVKIKPTEYHPEHGEWYDPNVLRRVLPKIQYDLLIVDGPPGHVGRGGLFKYRDLFNWDVPVIFDDAHRLDEWKLLRELNKRIKKDVLVPATVDGRMFAVLASKEKLRCLL